MKGGPATIYFLVVFLSSLFIGCKSKTIHYQPAYTSDKEAKKVLLFGVPSQSYYELCDSLVRYLNEHLQGVQVQTVASSTFAFYNEKLDHRYYDFTIANGMTALNSMGNGYRIIGRAVDPGGNSGTIVVNKDSAINSLADLKGKTVATPGPPALPGHILQMLYLNKHGLNVNQDLKFKYFESFESVFLNVYLGRCSVGFCTTTSWKSFAKRRPEIALKVIPKWQTPAIIGNAILFRTDMDKRTASQLKDLLLSIHTNQQGKNALSRIGFLRFDDADSNSYQSIRELIKDYDSSIIDH